MTTIGDVLTFGVPVSDQDRALEYYVDQLGFEKRRDASGAIAGLEIVETA
jgi:hypothetical protein